MDDLACTFYAQGRVEDARTLMNKALYLRNIKLGKDHLHTKSTANQLEEWNSDEAQTHARTPPRSSS